MDNSTLKSKDTPQTHCFPEIKSNNFRKNCSDDSSSDQFKQANTNIDNQDKTSYLWSKTDSQSSESELEQLISQAHEQGYSKGFKDGQSEEKKRVDKLSEYINQAIISIDIFKDQLLKYSEESVVKLVLAIVPKILAIESSISSDAILAITRNALKMVVDPNYIKIRVNPKDLEVLNANKEKLSTVIGKNATVQIDSDATNFSGGCIIETDFGDIDARIDSQMQMIEKALRHEMNLIAQQKQGESWK